MQENKYYTIEPEFKDVTKNEFNKFLESYPRPLISDFFMDSVSYNDFTLADRWPWSMVAIKSLGYHFEENEETTYRIAVNYIDMFNSKTGFMEDSTKYTKMTIKKLRPKTSIEWSDGNDGRDGRYYIEYRCPTCNRRIGYYMSTTACDECGTFYDWGNKEPHIEIERQVKW